MNSLVSTVDNIVFQTQQSAAPVPSMKDLLEDGVYLLFLLRGKNAPHSCAEFNSRIDQYLTTFERVCKTFTKPIESIVEAKYAFCALLDEIILSSGLPIRDEWERAPLQLRLFGEHLAGEGFFNKLENLRQDPASNIELLEVFHCCLLLGFQGKYLLEGTEKLNYLIAKLGQEISSVRGPSKGFAPNWKIPFKFNEYVRHELPLWLYYALLSVIGIAVFLSLQWLLGMQMAKFPSPLPSSAIEQRTVEPAGSSTPDNSSGLQAPTALSAADSEASPDSELKNSKVAREAEAEVKREIESEATSLKNSARSKTTSAVRSLIHR